jgi:hypothetical protein
MNEEGREKQKATMEDPDGSRLFDPICGMWLCADEIAVTVTYLGQTNGGRDPSADSDLAMAPHMG